MTIVILQRQFFKYLYIIYHMNENGYPVFKHGKENIFWRCLLVSIVNFTKTETQNQTEKFLLNYW